MKKTSKFICFIILCSILTCAVFLYGCSKKQPQKSTEHTQTYDKNKVEVRVFVDGVYTQSLYTDLEYNYKIIEPTKPEYTPSTNPNSEKYFYGWFTDPDFQTPLTANTTFRSDSAIYGKWITAYSNEFTYTVHSGIATITGVVGSPTVLVIPSYLNSFPVKAISKNAFYNETTIKTVIICNGIETIDGFENCNSMTNVQIPKSAKTISARCFVKCRLTRVTIPNGVTSIGSEAFSYCNELTKVTIPNGVTTIDSKAFLPCSKLTRISIPNTITYIGDYAFGKRNKLTTIIYRGTTVQWHDIRQNTYYMGNYTIECRDGTINY